MKEKRDSKTGKWIEKSISVKETGREKKEQAWKTKRENMIKT